MENRKVETMTDEERIKLMMVLVDQLTVEDQLLMLDRLTAKLKPRE